MNIKFTLTFEIVTLNFRKCGYFFVKCKSISTPVFNIYARNLNFYSIFVSSIKFKFVKSVIY